METLTKVKSFLSSWRNLLALGTLVPLGIWIYSRVWMVNPAILGDEYLYSMNSRKAAPWDPSPAGDFSNYLFNFVYQGTNLCGQAFYSCSKIFNLVFFLGFIFTLFMVAIRFLQFWAAYCFMIAAALSPLSVYTSMFLPESMYMFFVGMILIAVLHAMKYFTWQTWGIVGATIGIASLVKPHAWLSAIAVGITLLVVGLGNRGLGLRKTTLAALALLCFAAVGRLVVGLIVGGPKAIGFFGQYFGFSTLEQIVSGPQDTDPGVGAETSPISGVLALFGIQANVHILVISALMAISVVAVIIGVIEIAKEKKLTPVTGFALFAFIWLVSLMIEIVIFTGWVTGTGDDHTSRVLLRYYEFLFVIVPLAGLSVLYKGLGARAHVWVRWMLAGGFVALLTPAFTGFFSTLTIQIADAPTLAGLVVNPEVFNALATLGFIALIVFAAFPRYASWTFLFLLPVSMIATGWQIQDQYQMFRGEASAADKAGNFLRDNFQTAELGDTLIIANSRFEATNVAIWADDPLISYELYPVGAEVPISAVPTGKRFIVVIGELQANFPGVQPLIGEGYKIYRLD
jgi:hypothetical protein